MNESFENLCGHRVLSSFEWDQQVKMLDLVRSLPNFKIMNQSASTVGRRVCAWEVEQKYLGKALPLTWQNIGSCVGHGGFNVLRAMLTYEIVIGGDAERVVMPYLPYSFAASRQYGAEQHGVRWGNDPDGSTGLFFAEASKVYGFIENDASFIQPILKGEGADERLVWPAKADAQWAIKPFLPESLVTIGKQHLIGTTSPIRNYDEARDAIANGHFITMAWNFDLHPSEKRRGKVWGRRGGIYGGHQVAAMGVDDDASDPGVCIYNSWPPGYCRQTDGPDGSIWITADTFDSIAKSRDFEGFAFSQGEGYAENPLTLQLM